jgi:ABC-2 type transport system ATP-binding protein
MDEAERCHRLVILERGRLVAEGEPRALIENIGHAVFEIGGPNQRAIRLSVEALSITNSVAQLGNRLHVLIAAGCDNPEQILNDALRAANLDATVQETRPGLEDVFVAATGKG